MMKEYLEPTLEVKKFSIYDVITVSNGDSTDGVYTDEADSMEGWLPFK